MASGLLAALVAALPARGQSAADTASVRGFYRDWFSSAAQGGERYAGFYAPDGQLLPPNGAPVVGRPAIAAWLEQTRASATYTTRPEGLSVDEMRFLTSDWVLHRGTLWGQRVPRDGGEAVRFETKYVDLLHRTADGRWEVAMRMWSDNR